MPLEPLPSIGLGTMRYQTPEDCIRSVEAALDIGYRHIDTAQKYENEREVGHAIARSSVPREEIFLATKVAESDLDYDDVIESTRKSLDRLGVNAVDALYVHWPAITYDAEATLSAFNDLLSAGTTRHIGLANFSPRLLDEALNILDRPPLVVQVEMHPLLKQAELRAHAREHDIQLVAYCPLMRGEVFEVPELRAIADDAGLSIPQLTLSWLANEKNVVVIPKATGEAHLRENFEATAIDLDEDTTRRIEAIDRERRVVDPTAKGPWNW